MPESTGQILLGCVEQALCGGCDPLYPAISVSCNGTLAKWRDKFQVLDFRVNDPGLQQHRDKVESLLAKAASLEIQAIVTLPEVLTAILEPPPPPPVRPEEPQRSFDRRGPALRPAIPEKKPVEKKVDLGKLAAFKSCMFAIPRTVTNSATYHHLTPDECFPIMELAARHGVRHVIVPTSEPGLFLDPQAGEEFTAVFQQLAKQAKALQITLHVKNGGLRPELFQRLSKETGCRLALNLGTSHLEGQDVLRVYQEFHKHIDILLMSQSVTGLDKWRQWRDGTNAALRVYRQAHRRFTAAVRSNNQEARRATIAVLLDSFYAYFDARRSSHFNLGLFQNGTINYVPLLKHLRRELFDGTDHTIILETAPNLKNAEFLGRYLFADGGLSAPA